MNTTWDEIINEYEETQRKLREVLCEAIDKTTETSQAKIDILIINNEMKKFIEDVKYYQMHGSPTLPKNRTIND